MANMELITSVTVGSGGAASVTLPATGTIPQTYTDLKIVVSARGTYSGPGNSHSISLNGSSANFTSRLIQGSGTGTPVSGTLTQYIGDIVAANATANTFSNAEIYIPNYTSSNYKSISVDSVTENNATTAYATLVGLLWSNTAAITSITLTNDNGNYVEGSTFYLYGISKVTSTPKATGGIVSQDATYWYHMFPFTSTFTPTVALTADILCVAGGGGGGMGQYANTPAGGGGAGGLLAFTSQSLTATGYSVTVGAGGTRGIWNSSSGGSAATNGVNSQFASLTASVGGGRGAGWSDNNTPFPANVGGSGGGGYGQFSGSGAAGTSGQGNAGGSSSYSGSGYTSAGGGGAGGAGGSATSTTVNGAGGVGSSAYSSWGLATFTGEIIGSTVYYAGGGGVTAASGGGPSLGGYGGGGTGTISSSANIPAGSGKSNTGGGGGSGVGQNYGAAGNGGSGVVIVRYAK
jgi:hypothetical protein